MALVAAVFACAALPSPPQNRAKADKQTAPIASTLVLPISLGATTIGGIEGTVLRVTTLAADGPGSLRPRWKIRDRAWSFSKSAA